MGLWTSDKSLMWWIKTRWNPKGDVSLKRGSKGFFMTIFNLEEYRERVFQGGPYLFDFVGVYMQIWKHKLQCGNKIFHWSSNMDHIILAPIGVLVHENYRGYWKYSWILCQDRRGHPSRYLYLLCLDLCLPQCLQISMSINMP